MIEDVIIPILQFLWLIIWTPIHWVLVGLKKVFIDTSKGVYGKIIQLLTAIVFIFLIALVYKVLGK